MQFMFTYFRGLRGTGIGVKKQPANTFLEKKFKKKTDYSQQETIEVAFHCVTCL